jgi:sugar phosphate permease
VTGLVLVAAGLLWFSGISVDGSFAGDILGPSLLAAVGLGFAFVTTTIAAVSGIADHEQGLASGLINTSQQIGGALGLAVLATLANARTDDVVAAAGGSPGALPEALVEGFQSAFLGAALIAVIGLVLALVLIRTSDSRAHVALTERESEATAGA